MPLLAEYRDGMTRCTGDFWESQETCVYARKSTYENRCRFYVSDINELRRCDNPDAQEAARGRHVLKK